MRRCPEAKLFSTLTRLAMLFFFFKKGKKKWINHVITCLVSRQLPVRYLTACCWFRARQSDKWADRHPTLLHFLKQRKREKGCDCYCSGSIYSWPSLSCLILREENVPPLALSPASCSFFCAVQIALLIWQLDLLLWKSATDLYSFTHLKRKQLLLLSFSYIWS